MILLFIFLIVFFFFFFNDTATTEIYTLSLHDALPNSVGLATSGTAPCERYTSFRSRLETALPTSEFSRDTMSAGRRAGPTTPIHAVVSKPGKPDSARVGTSGMRAMRFALVTASTFTFPARACGRVVLTTSNL